MEQTTTKRPPFSGVRAFLNDFHEYVTPREPVTSSTLTRYRTAQDEGGLCAFCGGRYVPDCNSGVCA